MDQLIQLLIYIVIFAIAAYGLWWVCVKYELPKPVLWICGVILLIIILYFLAGQFGAGSNVNLLPRR